MKHPKLTAELRNVLGKKVKKLRRQGILPANVYGKDLNSTAVQVKLAEFQPIYKEVGETGLIDLQVDGQTRPVLVKNINIDFRTHTPLHADFFQVNLKEKVKTMVPLVLIGEPKAVSEKVGILLQQLNEVEVEALPEALPENIEVPVETLSAVDEQVTVADLKKPDNVTILTDESQTVARIGELVVEEAEPEPEAVAEGETPEEQGEGTTEEATPSDEQPAEDTA